MARYRKVDPRIWNDAKFRDLDDRGKLVFFFLLTHPHMTCLGAMRATVSGLSEELKYKPDGMRDAMRHAMSLGLIELDENACYVGLKNFLRYNEPEGPNSVVKAWPQALEMIPECYLKDTLIARCRKYLDGKSDAFRDAMPQDILDAFPYAMREPSAIQEQEQEQEYKPVQQENRTEQKPVDGKESKTISAFKDWTDDDAGIAICKALRFSGIRHPQWVARACPYIRERMNFKSNQEVMDWLPGAWKRYEAGEAEFKYGFEKWLGEGHYAEDKPASSSVPKFERPTEIIKRQVAEAAERERRLKAVASK